MKKFEIEIPDEFMPNLRNFAQAWGLTLDQAVSSLAMFQMCTQFISQDPVKWSKPEAFEILALPWGVQIVMNKMAEKRLDKSPKIG